jgi:hypothetical protein
MQNVDARYPDAMTPDAKYMRGVKIALALGRAAEGENARRTAAIAEQRAAGTYVATTGKNFGLSPVVDEAPPIKPVQPGGLRASDKRSVTILFAAAGDDISARAPAFYVGKHPEIAAELAGTTAEPNLAKSVRTTIFTKEKALHFDQDIKGRVETRHDGTMKALKRVAVAALNNGGITIVGDSAASPEHAQAIGKIIAGELRKIGHDVKLPQLEQQREAKAVSKEITASIGGR